MAIPRPPRGLPEELIGELFTSSDAVELGVSRNRLRRFDLDRRVRRVRGPAGAAGDLWGRCRLWAKRLPPGAFFSHSTAARLFGMPLPARLEAFPRLHVSVEAPARAPHAEGILGHSRVVVPTDVVVLDGLQVSSPGRTMCEMARVLPLPDLVALVDFIVHRGRSLASKDDLAERLTFGDRLSRSPRLRRALELSDDRAESPPESYLRVLCELNGFGRAEANWEVRDSTGRVFRLDLAWPDWRFAIEYHGDYHRSPEQWRRDLTRKAALEDMGWTILELSADDLHDSAMLLTRIRAGFARAR